MIVARSYCMPHRLYCHTLGEYSGVWHVEPIVTHQISWCKSTDQCEVRDKKQAGENFAPKQA